MEQINNNKIYERNTKWIFSVYSLNFKLKTIWFDCCSSNSKNTDVLEISYKYFSKQ